jgi:hypothetical protein
MSDIGVFAMSSVVSVLTVGDPADAVPQAGDGYLALPKVDLWHVPKVGRTSGIRQ